MQPRLLKPQKSLRVPMLTSDKVLVIVWESVVESVVNALLILMFGSVAIGIGGGVWRDMVPSPPPGFVFQPEAETTAPSTFSAWGTPLLKHRFLLLSGFLFALTLYFRLAGAHSEEELGASAGSRLQTIRRNLVKGWFRLVVVNAFGAMIAAIVVMAVAQFSPTKMFLGWLAHSALTGFQEGVGWLFGSGAGSRFQAWLDWYGENQLKFTFWLFYLGAICDDLGIPNFKALGRWLRRRYRRSSSHRDQPSR